MCAGAPAWEPPGATCAPKPQPAFGHGREASAEDVVDAPTGEVPRAVNNPAGLLSSSREAPTFKRSRAARNS